MTPGRPSSQSEEGRDTSKPANPVDALRAKLAAEKAAIKLKDPALWAVLEVRVEDAEERAR